MKRKPMLLALVLTVLVPAWLLWHTPSSAQGPLALFEYQDVQKELKLTDDQITKIKELIQKQKALNEFIKEKRPPKEEIRAKMREIFSSVIDTLKPEQAKRLEQLQMQQVGPAVFFVPLVARKIEIGDEQKVEIESIYKRFSKERFDLYIKGQVKKQADLDNHITSEIMGKLSDDQKNKLRKLTGEPFTGKLPPADNFPLVPLKE